MGSGETRELPNEVWKRILAYFEFTELSFLHLYADALSLSSSVSRHIWGQGRRLGAIAPSSPTQNRACKLVFVNRWTIDI